jgi:hypothetical protein
MPEQKHGTQDVATNGRGAGQWSTIRITGVAALKLPARSRIGLGIENGVGGMDRGIQPQLEGPSAQGADGLPRRISSPPRLGMRQSSATDQPQRWSSLVGSLPAGAAQEDPPDHTQLLGPLVAVATAATTAQVNPSREKPGT